VPSWKLARILTKATSKMLPKFPLH
jgi:hypothetical protein